MTQVRRSLAQTDSSSTLDKPDDKSGDKCDDKSDLKSGDKSDDLQPPTLLPSHPWRSEPKVALKLGNVMG